MSQLTYFQAIVIGLLQGVTELLPVSSLGHSVLLPAWIGGSWASTMNVSADGSPYLTFLVAVHVATAAALVVFFRHDWARIIHGLVSSVRGRHIRTADQRLAWLLMAATVPVGLAGLALDHTVRTTLGRPIPAAVFLMVNGAVLYGVERLRGRQSRDSCPGEPAGGSPHRSLTPAPRRGAAGQTASGIAVLGAAPVETMASGPDSDERLAGLSWTEAVMIGAAQIAALLPGVSRSGATISAGLLRGLDHEDAARFAFLLATPVIAAAGLLKLPELAAPAGQPIIGQVLVGSAVAAVSAYAALRWLSRYFRTHTLTPFAIYSAVAGTASLAWFTLA